MNNTLQRTPREELAWLAALLEGEGCFTLNSSHPNVMLGMTDYDVVEQAFNVAGVGHVTGPYAKKNKKHKPMWRWKVSRLDHVLMLCRAILPFMGERRTARIEKILSLDRQTTEPIWVRVDRWENAYVSTQNAYKGHDLA